MAQARRNLDALKKYLDKHPAVAAGYKKLRILAMLEKGMAELKVGMAGLEREMGSLEPETPHPQPESLEP